jgi:hypothetical protein
MMALGHHLKGGISTMGDKSPKKDVKGPKKDIKEKRRDKQEKQATKKIISA